MTRTGVDLVVSGPLELYLEEAIQLLKDVEESTASLVEVLAFLLF